MYMEIKKSKQAFWVAPGFELTTRNISHRKKAQQQYKSFMLDNAEGLRVRFTVVMILYFSLVKTFKIAWKNKGIYPLLRETNGRNNV